MKAKRTKTRTKALFRPCSTSCACPLCFRFLCHTEDQFLGSQVCCEPNPKQLNVPLPAKELSWFYRALAYVSMLYRDKIWKHVLRITWGRAKQNDYLPFSNSKMALPNKRAICDACRSSLRLIKCMHQRNVCCCMHTLCASRMGCRKSTLGSSSIHSSECTAHVINFFFFFF